jgi:hypothetical protein
LSSSPGDLLARARRRLLKRLGAVPSSRSSRAALRALARAEAVVLAAARAWARKTVQAPGGSAGFEREGLCRVSASTVEREALLATTLASLDAIDAGEAAPPFSFPRSASEEAVAGVLKLTLASLPDPLLTSALLPAWVAAGSLPSREAMRDACQRLRRELPPAHERVLRALLRLLAGVVDAGVNRMTPLALSTVMGPSFLPLPHDVSLADAARMATAINRVVLALVDLTIHPDAWPELTAAPPLLEHALAWVEENALTWPRLYDGAPGSAGPRTSSSRHGSAASTLEAFDTACRVDELRVTARAGVMPPLGALPREDAPVVAALILQFLADASLADGPIIPYPLQPQIAAATARGSVSGVRDLLVTKLAPQAGLGAPHAWPVLARVLRHAHVLCSAQVACALSGATTEHAEADRLAAALLDYLMWPDGQAGMPIPPPPPVPSSARGTDTPRVSAAAAAAWGASLLGGSTSGRSASASGGRRNLPAIAKNPLLALSGRGGRPTSSSSRPASEQRGLLTAALSFLIRHAGEIVGDPTGTKTPPGAQEGQEQPAPSPASAAGRALPRKEGARGATLPPLHLPPIPGPPSIWSPPGRAESPQVLSAGAAPPVPPAPAKPCRLCAPLAARVAALEAEVGRLRAGRPTSPPGLGIAGQPMSPSADADGNSATLGGHRRSQSELDRLAVRARKPIASAQWALTPGGASRPSPASRPPAHARTGSASISFSPIPTSSADEGSAPSPPIPTSSLDSPPASSSSRVSHMVRFFEDSVTEVSARRAQVLAQLEAQLSALGGGSATGKGASGAQ